MANRLNVTLLGGVYFVDHDHIRPPQIDFTGKVRQFMPRTVRINDHDFQIGNIERSVVVTPVPQNDIRFFLRLAENLLVIHSRIHHGPLADVRFILFAFLDGALLQVEVFHGGEPLHSLRRKIAVRHGMSNDHRPSTLPAQLSPPPAERPDFCRIQFAPRTRK